jgi:hypothetical protein
MKAELVVLLDGEDGESRKNSEVASSEAQLVGQFLGTKTKQDDHYKWTFAGSKLKIYLRG